MSDRGPYLSTQGERRREEIAGVARAAARSRRRHQLQLRTAGALVACLMLVCICIMEWPRQALTRNDMPRVVIHDAIERAPSLVVVTRIETDPNITARLAIPPHPPRWRVVGDDELLQTLAAAGHPAGLVRMNGQAILVLR